MAKAKTVAASMPNDVHAEARKGLRDAGRATSSGAKAGAAWLAVCLEGGNTDADLETYRVDYMTGFMADGQGWTDAQAEAWLNDKDVVKKSAPGKKPAPQVACYNNAKVQWGRVKFAAGIVPKKIASAPKAGKPAKDPAPKANVANVADAALAVPRFKDGAEALAFNAKLADFLVKIQNANAKLTGDAWGEARAAYGAIVKVIRAPGLVIVGTKRQSGYNLAKRGVEAAQKASVAA